jgi:hypothetical protein
MSRIRFINGMKVRRNLIQKSTKLNYRYITFNKKGKKRKDVENNLRKKHLIVLYVYFLTRKI